MQEPSHIQPPHDTPNQTIPRRKRRWMWCLGGCATLVMGCCGVITLGLVVGAVALDGFEFHIQVEDTLTEQNQAEPTPVPVTITSEQDLSTTAVKAFLGEGFETGASSDLLVWADREGYMSRTGFAQLMNWAYGGTSLPTEFQPSGRAITYSNNDIAEIIAVDDIGLLKLGKMNDTPLIWLVHVSGSAAAPVLHLVTSNEGTIVEGRYTSDSVTIYVDGALAQQRSARNGILLLASANRLQSVCTTGATDELVALMSTQGFFAGATTAVAVGTSTYFTLKGEPTKGVTAAVLVISSSTSVILMTNIELVSAALEDNAPVFRVSDPDPNGQWYYFCSDDARQVLRAPYYNYQIAAQDDREPPPEICADPACTMIEGRGSADMLLHANADRAFTVKDCAGNAVSGRIDKRTDRVQVYERCAGQTCVESVDSARCEDAAPPPDSSESGDDVAAATYTGTVAFADSFTEELEAEDARIDRSSISLTIPPDGGRVTGVLRFTWSHVFDPSCAERDVVTVEAHDFKGTYNKATGSISGTFSGTLTGKPFWMDSGCKIGELTTAPMGVSEWSANVSGDNVRGEIAIAWREGDDPVPAFAFQLTASR